MNTHDVPFPIQNQKITQNLQPREFFQGTEERVRNSRTEVLLYID